MSSVEIQHENYFKSTQITEQKNKSVEAKPNQEIILKAYKKVELPEQDGIHHRIWKHHHLSHYNRLLFLATISNLIFLALGLLTWQWWTEDGIALRQISTMVVLNLAITVLVRQQYIVNGIFWLCMRPTLEWPLWLRWNLAKVYHIGGLHSGCAASATIWFGILVASFTYHLANDLPGISLHTTLLGYSLVALFVCIIIFALPKMRSKYHNCFERMHRFGGWVGLTLTWTFTSFFINDQKGDASLISALLESVNFWVLLITTSSAIIPWLQLRKIPVKVTTPSSHVAIVEIPEINKPFVGSSSSVSLSPVVEWHAFANITSPSKKGYRLVISRAGDWTANFIDNPPEHVWVKGIPVAGVGHINKVFKRIVWIATGSGIGPILAHLLHKKRPGYLIWSTRTPRETYGNELVDEILLVQPDATIWDTTTYGKPDMVKLAYVAYKAFNAEAVVCISNQKLTRAVVYGMESRGIPAFGAIWDS